MVFKGGVVAWSAMGEGNASVHGAEPTRYGPDWGALGTAPASLSTTYVSQAALDAGIGATLGHAPTVAAVRGTRGLTRGDLIAGRAAPPVAVAPGDGTVTIDGRVVAAEPAAVVPLSRRYLLA